MNRICKATSMLLIIMLILLSAPVCALSAGEVTVVATADPTTLFEGDQTSITIQITNNTGADVDITGYTVDGSYSWINGITLTPGESWTLYHTYTVHFGLNLDYGFSIDIEYDGTQHAFSNPLEFHKDSYIVYDPPITTLVFTPSSDSPVQMKGGETTFSIYTKNTGNVVFEDFTIFAGIRFSMDLATFDLAPGESRTITYKESFDEDVTVFFSYYFYYTHEGVSNQIVQNNYQYIDVNVIDPKMSFTASPSTAAIDSGKEAIIQLVAKNTGDTGFTNVKLYDQNQQLIESWSSISPGASKKAEVALTPADTRTFKFTIKANDAYGNSYIFDSNEVLITVASSGQASPASTAEGATPVRSATAANTPDDTEGTANTAAAAVQTDGPTSNQDAPKADNLLVILIIVFAALLVAVGIWLIVYHNKSKKPKGN